MKKIIIGALILVLLAAGAFMFWFFRNTKTDFKFKEEHQVPAELSSTSPDGAVFTAKELENTWRIIREFEGQETIVGTWPIKTGRYNIDTLKIKDLVAMSKNQVSCTFVEMGPSTVWKTEEGTIMYTKDWGPQKTFTVNLEWDGSSWISITE